MLILCCGSRRWTDADAIRNRLGCYVQHEPKPTIMHGGAAGADTLCGSIAAELGFYVVKVEADWDRYGKSAGIKRNLAMLDHHPDIVLAFWDGRSPGTAHTISEARNRSIPCLVKTPSSLAMYEPHKIRAPRLELS